MLVRIGESGFRSCGNRSRVAPGFLEDRSMRGRCPGIGQAALVVSLSLGIAALPVSPDLGLPAAEARGGGGGGGGPGGGQGGGQGEHGGRGGGNDFGQGVAAAARGDAPGRGEGRGSGEGGGRGDRGALAAQLGALNAAHASPVARANAAPGSRVGLIAAYERAMLDALALPPGPERNAAIEAARNAELAAAANRPLTPEVVAAVDALLGLPPAP
jgi:hypothetical protein